MMIHCIEGVYLTDGERREGKIEPTVEPMLALLRNSGYCEGYPHRTCATIDELRYRLEVEWQEGFPNGSVLYFFTHGAPNRIWLSHDQDVPVSELAAWGVDLTDCHVHFGGCDTFGGGERDLRGLMDGLCHASSVSGYATESDFPGRDAPAVALELVLFALLSEVDLCAGDGRAAELGRISTQLNRRFPDCAFRTPVRN